MGWEARVLQGAMGIVEEETRVGPRTTRAGGRDQKGSP